MNRSAPSGGQTLSARHLEQLSAEQLRQLLLLSQHFNATVDIAVLLPQMLAATIEELEAEAGSIWLVHSEAVRCEASTGPQGDRLAGVELPLGAGFVGHAVRAAQPLLLTNARADGRYLHQLDELSGLETRSVMVVPLVSNGETLGAIEVTNRRSGSGYFEQEHHDFLIALSDDAAAAIRNARLFEAEKQATDLRALLEFSHEIGSTFDLDRIFVSIVNLAGHAIPFHRCALATWAGQDLVVRSLSGETKIDPKSSALREIDRFMTWATEGREELLIVDVQDPQDDVAAKVRSSFTNYLEESGARSILVEDIRDAEGELGVLLFEFTKPNAVSAWGQQAARLLANEAALALRNAQLYAGVPFISWLEPLAKRRRQLTSLPRAAWARYVTIAAAVLAVLLLVRFPLRVAAREAAVRAAVQRPVRAGVEGILDAVLVEEGQRVERGTPIARLRDEPGLIRMREAERALALAEQEALTADARGDANAGTIARLRAAEAADALDLLRREQQRTLVVAQTAGIVLTPRLDERVGGHFDAGGVIAWVGDPDWIELELRVAQADIAEIRIEDRVRARVNSYPALTFGGSVTAIAPRADATAGEPAYTVRALLDNRQRLLRPGMQAHAKVYTRSRPLIALALRRPWRWLRLNAWWWSPL